MVLDILSAATARSMFVTLIVIFINVKIIIKIVIMTDAE